MFQNRVETIRTRFRNLLKKNIYTKDGTIERVNASFISDEVVIFGEVTDYAEREVEWYLKQSLQIQDIPGEIPQIWRDHASPHGRINSNYGWCMFHEKNFKQFESCIQKLIEDKSSRQAVMIYMRPSMHIDAHDEGMSDFMCTYAAQILIREDLVHYIVNMRSNDAVFGYKNDRYWHNMIFKLAMERLEEHYRVKRGDMFWNAGSLHVYPRHFNLVEESK